MPEAVAAVPAAASTPAPEAPQGAPEAAADAVVTPPTPAEADKLARARAVIEKGKAGAERRREQIAKQAEQDRRWNQVQAENAELRRQSAWALDLRQKAANDKFAAARELGLSPKEIAEQAALEGSPEGQLTKIRQELAAEREERLTLQRQIEAEKAQAAYRTATSQFLSSAQDATRFPTLADKPPTIVLAAARQILTDARDEQGRPNGHMYSQTEVLEFLENHWASYQKERSSKKDPPASSPKESPPGSATSRTVTNAIGARSFSLPTNFDDLSDREQKRLLAAAIESTAKR